MAKTQKTARRPPTRPPGGSGGPRRLGESASAPRAPSSGAARRAARRQTHSNRIGWIAVGLVLVIVAVFVVVKLTGGSSTPPSATGDSAGRNPALASISITQPVETVPASVFNSVGTAGNGPPLTVTKNQPVLRSGSLPRFVYMGAEYCPYCAMMRWSLVAALSRFGTFSGLKVSSSASTDGNIPTFSFFNSTFTSPYLVFSPYEFEDRNQAALQSVPNYANQLYSTYDGTGSTPTKFDSSPGIPFLDIANKYVVAGDPAFFGTPTSGLMAAVYGGGPGPVAIADAVHSPSSPTGVAIHANELVAQANFITAAVCAVDGARPASVCTSSGVKAAAKVLAAEKPIG